MQSTVIPDRGDTSAEEWSGAEWSTVEWSGAAGAVALCTSAQGGGSEVQPDVFLRNFPSADGISCIFNGLP
ncbi:uncharacterized protein Dsimw501_GD27009 [Drosophila simulans]|uniref:Uncharacterized protein n=1 Tax=Drosophila simulans TaxID=7240 RepID=A0A0J9RFZ4_DROSI|nr:uncharacterized protein Dsimw501_GD27009 [Drosophila simulans]